MAKKNERKRVAALECDPLVYRREVPNDAFEASQIGGVAVGEEVSLVGRLMLSDKSGAVSRLGVYHTPKPSMTYKDFKYGIFRKD